LLNGGGRIQRSFTGVNIRPEARLFYTLLSAVEFWKIFRGWEKN
jgi:hypothetical protein